MRVDRGELDLGHAALGAEPLQGQLVHAGRRGEHVGADVGDVEVLEQALDAAVLAERAVQGREGGVGAEQAAARARASTGSSPAAPLAGAADRHRHHLVAGLLAARGRPRRRSAARPRARRSARRPAPRPSRPRPFFSLLRVLRLLLPAPPPPVCRRPGSLRRLRAAASRASGTGRGRGRSGFRLRFLLLRRRARGRRRGSLRPLRGVRWPITFGTFAFCFALATTIETVAPGSTRCPAAGDWSSTSPAGAESVSSSPTSGTRPRERISCTAVRRLVPTRTGTLTSFGPRETKIVTVEPLVALSPPPRALVDHAPFFDRARVLAFDRDFEARRFELFGRRFLRFAGGAGDDALPRARC